MECACAVSGATSAILSQQVLFLCNSTCFVLNLRVKRCGRQRSSPLTTAKRKDSHVSYPPQYFDDEWQAQQREKHKEFLKLKKKEEAEERKKVQNLRAIGSRFGGYPETAVKRAKNLVANFIKAGEGIEEMIEEAADNGELSELVLLVIWSRLEIARQDDEREAIQALDLLYRRVQTEILKKTASPAMQLLNSLLNLYDGEEYDWLQQCSEVMLDVFPCEDPSSIIVPPEFMLSEMKLPPDDKVVLFRADFVRETDALLQEMKGEVDSSNIGGFDPRSVALSLKFQQKHMIMQQIKALRDLAINLKWLRYRTLDIGAHAMSSDIRYRGMHAYL